MVCRRYPPTVIAIPIQVPAGQLSTAGQVNVKMLSQFSPVNENFWCGEHKVSPFMDTEKKPG
jgi:hypothetical protein